MPPQVSICLPVLNGEALVGRALRSALEQDHSDIEVVVVDDASTDRTETLIREEFGNAVRLFRRVARSGQAKATNAAIALSQGEYVKFLHHDDVLDPDCVSAMVEILDRYPAAGMVFCRRRLELPPGQPDDGWGERYRDVHRGFGDLRELNGGDDLFGRLMADQLHHNWIGEPVCVMVRRACLEKVGCFGLHVRGSIDLGLWLRVAAHCDVAFIDRELVTYRHSTSSHIKRTRAKGETWLDRLWMLELLCTYPTLVERHPELAEFRRRERSTAFRTAVATVARRQHPNVQLSVWWEYESFRLRRLVSNPPMVGSVANAAEGTVPVNSRAATAFA